MTDHAHPHPQGSGHGHAHTISADADGRLLRVALGLLVTFMAGEVLVGIAARSLALISDAAHMLTDAAAIVLALAAARLARRPATGRMTYGWRRVEILAAQANGLTLLLLSVWLAYESVRRLIDPPEVEGGLVLGTAVVGVAVNVAATWVLAQADRTSLNVEGAFQHVLTDLYAFIATAVAGALVLTTGWNRLDPVASLVVVALMTRSGLRLVRESGRIFLEAAPAGLSPQAIGASLAAVRLVHEVHDLHVWEITSGQPALSAHVLVEPGADCHALRLDLESMLTRDYAIGHTTLQVDHAPATTLRIGPPPSAHPPHG
ncbi:cation diffusion facilitator family transporter [Spongisporangium articulatum]|uniref:Cation diffusion facilitator family transporter n=1 Tax=Spongisporangium articulatum TaxID=3362603 RepID=A0ABW8AJ50_9ACTN